MNALWRVAAARTGWLVLFLSVALRAAADDQASTNSVIHQLQLQNQQLLEQLQRQQGLIDALTTKVNALAEIRPPDKGAANGEAGAATTPAASESTGAFHVGKVAISGEGGLAFFKSEAEGPAPNSEFIVDEARLFIEAPVWNDVYFSSEINLATREQNDYALRFGQVYLDFEDVSKLWGRDRWLNVRVGQFYIPFGEEYQQRYAIDNPLISHSVSDIWGEDAGLELYGEAGRVRYAAAVQNGGSPPSMTLNGDKSVAGRISFDPARWLHLSASGMWTGNLNATQGMTSALWFGGGWIRSLNFTNANNFHATLAELDAQLLLSCVQLKAAGGYINYGDNDPAGNTDRDVYYYYLEGVHDLTSKLYCAGRFSEIFAHGGFPIVGGGTMADYFYSPDLTSEYWRLSLGLGYRLSRNLVIKGEYTFNHGHTTDGEGRSEENAFGLEAAFQF